MDAFVHYLWLVPLGVTLGLFGTLIGAGGGFLLVPLLLLLYPKEEPEVITSISLAVVGINAISGSISYGRICPQRGLHQSDWRGRGHETV